MSVLFECKACGGELDIIGEGVGRCTYCGSKQPIPKNNEVLFNRANKLRLENKDFEEANKIYKEILQDSPNDSEVYWGMLLCRYGIEYVKDNDGKYLPTCHRTVMSSIVEDVDLNSALSNADTESFNYYKEQAILIDKYQQEIKKIVANEKPYDVFISFKAKDDVGFPTQDSMLAQKIYNYLSKELKLKVFFSNVTLQNRAGEEFEPIIFAALQSARVMVLVGTTPENINSTWVKNEWSRYIRMVSEASNTGKKKRFIPALLNMKPEELPSELSCFQAMDMSIPLSIDKLGNSIDMFIGDEKVSKEQVISTQHVSSDLMSKQALNLLTLGNQKLKQRSYDEAIAMYLKAVQNNIELSDAYWGILLAKEKISTTEELEKIGIEHIEEKSEFQNAVKYAAPEKKELYNSFIFKCNKQYMINVYQNRYNKNINDSTEKYRTFDDKIKFTESSSSIARNYFETLSKKSNLADKLKKAKEKESKYSNKELTNRIAMVIVLLLMECGLFFFIYSEPDAKDSMILGLIIILAYMASILLMGVVVPIAFIICIIRLLKCFINNRSYKSKLVACDNEYNEMYNSLYNIMNLLADDSAKYITNYNTKFTNEFKYSQDIKFVKSTFIKEVVFDEESIKRRIITDIDREETERRIIQEVEEANRLLEEQKLMNKNS